MLSYGGGSSSKVGLNDANNDPNNNNNRHSATSNMSAQNDYKTERYFQPNVQNIVSKPGSEVAASTTSAKMLNYANSIRSLPSSIYRGGRYYFDFFKYGKMIVKN